MGDTSEQQAGQVSSSAEVTETKSSDAPAADPADEPAVNPAIDPTVDPTTDPATEPTADPAVDPAADPAVDPTKSGADAPADTPSDEQGSTTGQGASAEEEPTQKPTEEKTEAQTTATESEKDADDPAAAEAAGAKIAESIATQLKPVVKKLAAKVSATSTDPFVIVIDAGHGGFDSGAVGNGLQEHALNLSIAKHIQELLQGFANVVVYLTRTTNTSLKPDTKNDLVARVNFAVQHHADVFISVHTNSGPAAAHGIEVIAQNDSSYRYALHAESMGLATAVFNAERAIGLASHSGVYTRDYGSGAEGKYPDGSNADYLSLLRNCRINNIPAILIENLFISNPSDAAFLSSDANRQKIAQAIVNGIAKYYNLSKNLVSDSKGLRYLNDDKKTYAKNTFKTIGSNTYYFGDDTYAVKWEQNIGGKEYYFNGSYIMQTGVITFLKTGKVKLYGSDGAWVTTDGFSTVNGNTYYVKDSTPLRWEQRVGEKVYYFDGNYVMHTGWLTWNSDKTRSYFGVDGA
ncbi:MAG: N-acetylmuramoyl-L-alanine amidase, partial [Olegusella sp.]|nr:N-acetylmuramoyl-L-alanine amidase [Olegusella sp.]